MGAADATDWSWAVATGGNLTRQQRRQLLTSMLRTVPGIIASRSRLAVGRRGRGGVDLDKLRRPDSALARAAEQEALDVLSPPVWAHSHRMYLYGLSLAALEGAPVDEEVCYVACLLHDLHLGVPAPGRCFAVVGAQRAEQFALTHDTAPEKAAKIGSAIAAHINVGEGDLSTPEGFVGAGAFLDVSGHRIDELRELWVTDLLERYPRKQFKQVLLDLWARESVAVPDGRARWLWDVAGLPRIVKRSPFDE